VNTVRLVRLFVSAHVLPFCLPSTPAMASAHSSISLPVTFEENRGQAPEQYLFLSRHNGVEAMFLKGGVNLSLPGRNGRQQNLMLRLSGSSDSAGV
jgi:hypothetical protein